MATTHAAAFIHSRGWTADEFTDLLHNPASFSCGDADCFALIRVIVDEAELLTIATHPRCQRQGMAHTLMEKWQTVAHRRGATRAFLEVAADNDAAITLYQSMGYETCGLRRGYYPRKGSQPVDAVVMARALT